MNESDYYTIADWLGISKEQAEKVFNEQKMVGNLFVHRPGIIEIM